MHAIKSLTSRGTSLLAVLAFTAATIAPLAFSGSAYAGGQFSPRKLTISSSASGNISTDANGVAVAPGSGGNGAKANHKFDFTMGTSGATVRSIALQYCDTPLFGTTCTPPTGLDASTITSIAAQSGFTGTAATLDTATVANTGGIFTTSPCSGSVTYRQNCILVTRSGATNFSGTPALNLAFGQTGGGNTDWIKNPTAVGTFYVRITAFSDATYTTVVDEAAVAASITTGIDITAKVQEKLNFSVAAAKNQNPGTSCAPLTGPGAISLGSGGVLDTSTAYDEHSYWRLSTNAANGTSVLYSGDTLKTASGTNSISAVSSAGAISAPGTSQFGLGLDSADTAQFGHSLTNMTATSPYGAANGAINGTFIASFAFNVASMTTPVEIASAAQGTTVSCDTGSVRYLANVSPVTKPGVYKTTINYIATPTF
jgi:hypothetical protein